MNTASLPSYFDRFIVLLLFILFTSSAVAQKRKYTTQKLEGTGPRIDGIIDEAVWNIVSWEGGFEQTEPYENQSPSQPTEFKILYDNNNLYVAIRAYDSAPDSINKRMSRRDGFTGDMVAITLDSYNDQLTSFNFIVSASGVKNDEKVTNDDHFDVSWDPIWYVKTSIDNQGWIAEFKIPFSQLRFGRQDEYTWGMNVIRHIFRKGEQSMWQPISPKASGWVNHFGELYGIQNIVPKKQFDITPYLVGRMENYQEDSENPFADGRDYMGSIGIDGKIGVTSDLTLDFTINPDFGQVEADPSEVNLSTFETFFPERRAFFIEGNNIINHKVTPGGGSLSSDNLFYSRRIGRKPNLWPETDDNYDEYVKMPENTTILGAFKLTGKTKKGLSIGIMESFTQLEHADVARKVENGTGSKYQYRKVPIEPFTNYFAARVEQDLNSSNTRIGAMVTATNRDLFTDQLKTELHSAAYTAGFNFSHQWKNKTYYLNLNAVASTVRGSQEKILSTQTESPHFLQRSDARHLNVDSTSNILNGSGGTLQFGKAGNGKWRFTNWLTYRSPGVNLNEIGFLRRTDEFQQVFWIQYQENEPNAFYRRYSINFNQWFGATTGPEYRYFGGNVNAHMIFTNHWYTGIGSSREAKSLSSQELRGGPSLLYDGYTSLFGYLGTDSRKKIQFELGGNLGGHDDNTSIHKGMWLEINMQLADAFKLSLEPRVSNGFNEIEYVGTEEYQGEDRYIRARIERFETSITVRFNYNITPDFTIQYYAMPFISDGQYSGFKYIIDPKAKTFSDRFESYSEEQLSYSEDNEEIYIDENLNGEADYTINNPNFRVLDFNSNLVLRWEYLPGSSLYLVWTQQRSKYSSTDKEGIMIDSGRLFTHTYPHDIFLVKLSYRFGI
jgi:hypothetical protein